MTHAGSRNNWTPRKSSKNWTADEETLETDSAITVCPQPRRAVLLPGSPDKDRRSFPGSPHSTIEEQAREELRELMGCAGREKDSFPSSGGRPLSSVSTSCGATPDVCSWPVSAVSTVPSTPQFPRLEEVGKDLEDEKADKENSVATYGGYSKATRQKIFVGGVPQEVDQDEVKNFMSEWGAVKKAWLQKHKESPQGAVNNTQRHRGFGFVIFNDAAAVDKLLGDKSSRYLTLADGRRIEVKRAVSSADMQKNVDSDIAIGPPRQPQQPGLKQPLQASWNGGQRQQPGQSGPTSSLWLSDPRQSPQHGLGGFTTPDHNSSNPALLGTPPRVPPMQQGRLTPVPPPPTTMSPWKQSPTPPPLIAALPLMAGSVMMMPRAPGPTNQASSVLPVGNALAPMQCGSVPMRPNVGNTSQQQVSATAPTGQPSVAGQVPGHQAPWNNTAMVCSIPWSMVQGSTSVPCPGGPPAGWAAQWEVAMAASQQQQQLLQIRPPQHQSPQQQSRELLQIQEDQLLQLEEYRQHQPQANDVQLPHASSHAAQVQVPVRPQTPISPGSPQQLRQLEQALRQAMPDHYDE